MILIIGCQNSWSPQEKEDFIKRCIKYKPDNKTLDSYKVFCDCILKNFMSLNLSYSQFLKIDSNSDEIELSLK